MHPQIHQHRIRIEPPASDLGRPELQAKSRKLSPQVWKNGAATT
jgi:hypothetical protein